MGILEKIAEIEAEMARTQKNKATEYHLGLLRGKLAKLKTQLLEPSKSGGTHAGFEVGRYGDARVAIMGFPSVGKSSLLAELTGVKSEVAAYEFTTLTCIPGVIYHNDAKIQLLDLPGIIDGAAQGRGRGRQVISTAKSADLILVVLDATKDDSQKKRLEAEMESVGIRLNKTPPNIKVTKKPAGGVRINASCKRSQLDDKLIEGLLREYRIFNADVIIREDASAEDFIDVLEGNRKYVRCVYCYNKIDMLSVEQIEALARLPHSHVMSCNLKLNLDRLKDRIWEELSMVRVYTKKKGQFPEFSNPLVITPQRGTKECNVENAVTLLHKDLLNDFKCALVWGTSVKSSPATAGLKHYLQDEDVIQIQKLTAAEKQKKMHGKKTGTTEAGTGNLIDPKKQLEKKQNKTGPRS
ncbi:unnamed protein product [Amoebophrya sp. A120]|nr:unnamed protein product [Amoebophrya sp. A120]|eukprot:GSA120T00013948001.1